MDHESASLYNCKFDASSSESRIMSLLRFTTASSMHLLPNQGTEIYATTGAASNAPTAATTAAIPPATGAATAAAPVTNATHAAVLAFTADPERAATAAASSTAGMV